MTKPDVVVNKRKESKKIRERSQRSTRWLTIKEMQINKSLKIKIPLLLNKM
jgi:hypothetical protein